jgi:uncharacterized protein YraI
MSQRQPIQYTLRITVALFLTLFLAAACSSAQDVTIPTLMVLPSLTPSPTVDLTVVAVAETAIAATATSAAAAQIAQQPTLPPTWTLTPTPIPTLTPMPTQWPTATPTATLVPSATITATASVSPTPQGDAFISGANGANLRPGPGREFNPPVALLPPGTEILLVGRSSDSHWFQANTFDGLSGWVSFDLVQTRVETGSLSVTWIVTPAPAVVNVPQQNYNLPPELNLPPLTNNAQFLPTISDRTRQIFRQGQQMGLQRHAFSKVGDSITADEPFLLPIGAGNYDLGPYVYLQDSINFFSISPREGQANSFVAESMAAAGAFNGAAVLSSIWADPTHCLPNEIALNCEYRLTRPSVSIIMLGSVDMQIYTVDEYRSYMDQIVQTTISQGIIPVLTTFPNAPDFHAYEAETFNAVIREIANREQIPLIDLRAATDPLPNHGVGNDGYHLSYDGTNTAAFNGPETQWGLIMRDLLTLQALDILRREVLTK